MVDQKVREEIASVERRNFLKLAGAGGITAALVAAGTGVLSSSKASA